MEIGLKQRRKRPRLTIALLMAVVASCALLFALLTPLMRNGVPPCMSHGGMVCWLLSNMGKPADCNQCHMSAPPSVPAQVASRITQLVAPTSPAHASGDRKSCLQCHSAPPAS